uniref:Prepilin leader peptidase/N-methyltransferase n=1 Tax=uncultured Aquificia bacterium TaxID=453415 RepID=H5SDV4_9BACT|nr:prepilin peptidase / N-methyltransferase [uncultured Aquificae bacterium]
MDYLALFVLGCVLGSFYNVLIYRLPRGTSIVKPPSHCPVCGSKIRWYHNIPVISYLVLRGRCRSCSASISIRYPLVELSSGLLAILSYIKWGFSFESFVMFVFFSLLLVLSLIDWDTFLLPDSLNLGGLAFGLITSLFRTDFSLLDSLAGALAGAVPFFLIYVFYVKVRKMEGLGFGDVKLMAFIGSVTGIWGVLYAVFLGSVFGLLYALPIIFKNRNLSFAVPYGPFLSLGCFVGTVFDQHLRVIFLP